MEQTFENTEKWLVAYASKHTNMEWQSLATYYQHRFEDARRDAEILAERNHNLAIGVFCLYKNDLGDWRDQRPRYLFNRHILFQGRLFSPAVGQLVNLVNSDFTINNVKEREA